MLGEAVKRERKKISWSQQNPAACPEQAFSEKKSAVWEKKVVTVP